MLGLADSVGLLASLPQPTKKASMKTLINTNKIRFIISPVHPLKRHTVKTMVIPRDTSRTNKLKYTKYTIYTYYTINRWLKSYTKITFYIDISDDYDK